MSLRFLAYKSPSQTTKRVGIVNATATHVTPLNFPSGRPVTDLHELVHEWDLVSSNLLPGTPVESIGSVEVLAPLTGRDVLCVGKNYKDHAREFQRSGFDSSDKNEQPDFPVIFTKRATSIVATHTEIYPHPQVTDTLDYEGELGVIIGKAGAGIKKEDAWKHIWGVTIINDVTARERQRDHKQFYIGKSLDTFCPMGPYAVHASNVDWNNTILETRVNGEVRQREKTTELIFDIPTLIETCSMGITLQPGDVIATGTPAGVGIGKNPPIYLKSGDLIEIEITGLGTLSNVVASRSAPPPAVEPIRPTSVLSAAPPPDKQLVMLKSGLRLHIEVSNPEGKSTALFVHGLGGSSTNYGALIEQLSLAQTYCVVTFDFEGHGLSPLSGERLSVEGLASYLAEILDHVGARSATIFGHSLGGLIATTFAASFPDRVDKLVLVGPVKAFAPAGVNALTGRAATVREGGMSAVASTVAGAGVSAKTASSRFLAKSAVYASLLATPAEGYAQACLAAASAQDPDYAQIRAPTLIISGSEDKTAPQPTIEFLNNAIKGSKVVQISDVGHWIQVEDHESTAGAVKSFL
ncbi:hypothetical protein OIO90_004078 [Microbotryomycetes sp. JL221]|nr:hypothetical protein OIO90_004078 [Microbotryomycetes sp. JL221]